MAEDDIFVQRLFERVRSVEWNEEKAASNRRKHGIDFDEAIEIFYGTSLLRRSDRNGEERWLAIGENGRSRRDRRRHVARRYAPDHLSTPRAKK
jgi:uncharacterized DUF497 family protein